MTRATRSALRKILAILFDAGWHEGPGPLTPAEALQADWDAIMDDWRRLGWTERTANGA